MADDDTTPAPKKEGIFQKVWGFVSEHGAIVLGVVAGLGVIYYLFSSSQGGSGQAAPTTVSFPPTDTGGAGGGAGSTAPAPVPTVPAPAVVTPTLGSWLASIAPSLLSDTASWQSLTAFLTGTSTTLTQGALNLYNELAAIYGAPPSGPTPTNTNVPPAAPTTPAFLAPNPPTGFFSDLWNRITTYGSTFSAFATQFDRTTSQYLGSTYSGSAVEALWASLYGNGQTPTQSQVNAAIIAFLNNPANAFTANPAGTGGGASLQTQLAQQLPVVNPQAMLGGQTVANVLAPAGAPSSQNGAGPPGIIPPTVSKPFGAA